MKVKEKGQRKIKYQQFQKALGLIAEKKGKSQEEIEKYMLGAQDKALRQTKNPQTGMILKESLQPNE